MKSLINWVTGVPPSPRLSIKGANLGTNMAWGFRRRKLNVEIDRQDTAYFIPYRCLIRLLGTETAFRPDVIVLDKPRLVNEPLWHSEPVITLGASIKLVVEVVSTNWQNDYARKLEDYAILGVRRVLERGLSWYWWQRVYWQTQTADNHNLYSGRGRISKAIISQ